jgi:hypothetical protein
MLAIKAVHVLIDTVQPANGLPLRGVSVRIRFDDRLQYTKFVFDEVQVIEDPRLMQAVSEYQFGDGTPIREVLLRGPSLEKAAESKAPKATRPAPRKADGGKVPF